MKVMIGKVSESMDNDAKLPDDLKTMVDMHREYVIGHNK
jgi:hypothetical protein